MQTAQQNGYFWCRETGDYVALDFVCGCCMFGRSVLQKSLGGAMDNLTKTDEKKALSTIRLYSWKPADSATQCAGPEPTFSIQDPHSKKPAMRRGLLPALLLAVRGPSVVETTDGPNF